MFLMISVQGVTLENIYTSGCNNERIRLECPKGHKIAIKRLFYGVKSNRRCTELGRKYSDDCCHPTYDDCLVSDDDSKYPFLNMMCSGLPGCDIEANNASSGSKCRNQGYDSVTSYMTVIHDCIPGKNSGNFLLFNLSYKLLFAGLGIYNLIAFDYIQEFKK